VGARLAGFCDGRSRGVVHLATDVRGRGAHRESERRGRRRWFAAFTCVDALLDLSRGEEAG